MQKWKCSVCGYVMDAEDRPEKCKDCDADSHKIKSLYRIVRKKSAQTLSD